MTGPLYPPRRVLPVPLRPLDVATDRTRGGTRVVGPESENVLVEIIDLRQSCSMPGEPIQITLGVRIDGDGLERRADRSDAWAFAQLRCLLEWGLGDVAFAAECDFGTGTLVSVVAETIKVSAFYRVQRLRGCREADECLPTFTATAALGYGCASRARLTECVFLRHEGDRVSVPVPPFARSVFVQATDDEPVDVEVVATAPVRVGRRGRDGRVEIFNGASSVEVTSRSARAPIAAALGFELSI